MDVAFFMGFFQVEPYGDLKIGALAAVLPGAGRYRDRNKTVWPGASVV